MPTWMPIWGQHVLWYQPPTPRLACIAPCRVRTALEEMDASGEFKRKESQFRNWIRQGSEFEPEGKPRRLAFKCATACARAPRA